MRWVLCDDRAKQNPHHVITVSHTRGEIAVWNIYTMQAVRTLKGIHQPQSLKMIDEYRCLVRTYGARQTLSGELSAAGQHR